MSKAFVREDGDSAPEENEKEAGVPGGKNYITPAGFKRLQDELKHLKHTERPEVTRVVSWAAGNGDRSENGDYLYGKKRLREIDKRLRFISKRLDAAEVVDPLKINAEHVLFGATVQVRYEDDTERTFSIVGMDEVDLTKNRISWISPIARALMKGKVGDLVTFNSPKGEQTLEILSVVYREID